MKIYVFCCSHITCYAHIHICIAFSASPYLVLFLSSTRFCLITFTLFVPCKSPQRMCTCMCARVKKVFTCGLGSEVETKLMCIMPFSAYMHTYNVHVAAFDVHQPKEVAKRMKTTDKLRNEQKKTKHNHGLNGPV